MKGVQLACLIVGALAAFVANSPKIYSAVKEQWKGQFKEHGWKDNDISNVYATSSIGFFIVPCGMIYDSFGTFGVLLYGTILTVSGFGGIAYLFKEGLAPQIYGLLFALTIQGGCALNFGAIWTNSKVFPPSMGGMVTGVMLGVYSCGALAMVQLWRYIDRVYEHDVQRYVYIWSGIVLAVGVITTTVLPMLYKKHVKQVAEEAENAGDRQRAASINALAKNEKPAVTAAPAQPPITPVSAIFGDIRFWMIASIYCFCTALGMAWGGNFASIMKAYWYDDYVSADAELADQKAAENKLGDDVSQFLMMFVVTELAARLGMGIISDLVAKYVARIQVICALVFLMSVSMFGQVFFGSSFTVPMMVLMGLSYAGLYSVVPPYLRTTFDVRRFGLITGMGYSFMIPGNFLFVQMFSYFYDKNSNAFSTSGASMCKGNECYRTTFLYAGIGTIIPFLFTLILSFFDNSVAEANAAARAATGYGAAAVKDQESHAGRRRSSLSVPEYHPDLDAQEEFQRVAEPDDEQGLIEKGRSAQKAH